MAQRFSFSWTTDPKRCNQKTGPIPSVYVSSDSCPPSCGVREYCYAKQGNTNLHWRRTDEKGGTLAELCAKLRALLTGQLWRYGVAGDLPGDGDAIDRRQLLLLASDQAHTKAIAYTHKPVLGPSGTSTANRKSLRQARELGLSVNLSSDSLSEADAKSNLDCGPVVVTLPEHGPWPRYTHGGRSVVVCPAVLAPGEITCETCRLCAKPDRQSIIGFPAHGSRKAAMSKALRMVE